MSSSNAVPDGTTLCPVDEWDHYLETVRPEIGHKQASWWAEFQRLRGWDSFSVVARDGDAICGGATVLVKTFMPGKCFYYIPHGPVLPEDEADAAELFDGILAYVDDQRKQAPLVVSHLRLEPRWVRIPPFVRGVREAPGWLEPRNTVCIDLSLSEDSILGQMKKKGRYNIGVARRHGVTVVEDTSPRGLDDFMCLYKATVQRQGIGRHSTGYFRNLAATLFPHQRGSIFFAEYQGVRLATSLVLYCGDTATYKYGGSLGTHRNVMSPYLLQFEGMRKAKALGYKWYDLYGVSPPNKPIEGWENFSTFKRKLGGHEMSFVPALDVVYDADAYHAHRAWEIS